MEKKSSKRFPDVGVIKGKVYISMREFIADAVKVVSFSNHLILAEYVKSLEESLGIYGTETPDDAVKSDYFVVQAILFDSISSLVGRELNFHEYLSIKKHMETSLINSDRSGSGVLAELMKLFNIDESLIPASLLAYSMKINELNTARDIINTEIETILGYDDEFDGYDDYFEYVKKEALRITNKLNSLGYFGVHDIEIFTSLIISVVVNTPVFGSLYFVDDEGKKLRVPREEVFNIQRQIFEKIDEIRGN